MSRAGRAGLVLVVAWCCSACGDGNDKHPSSRDSGPPVKVPEAGTDVPLGLSVSPDTQKHDLGSTVTITASLTSLASSEAFSVLDPGQRPLSFQRVSARTISLRPEMIGTYTVRFSALLPNQSTVEASTSVVAVDPAAPKRYFLMRVTPPPGNPRPVKEQILTFQGADQLNQLVMLEDGVPKQVKVTWDGAEVDTQIRLYRLGEDPAPRDLWLAGGKGELYLPSSFRALFIPQQPVAPGLGTKVVEVGQLPGTWEVAASSGVKVSGVVMNGASPVSGAAVSLATSEEDVLVPSTVGLTGADGAYELKARAPQGTLMVAPPVASGLPVAVAKLATTVGSTSAWTFSYKSLPAATVEARLARSDGTVPAAGAMLVLSRSDAPEVGSLSAPSLATPIPATGRFRYTFVTDGAGQLREAVSGVPSLSVMAGTYTAEVWPAGGEAPEQGYAVSTQTLAAGSKLQLKLGRRARLSGTISAELDAAVTIIARGAGDRTFMTSGQSNKAFTLSVDDSTQYTLVTRAEGPVGNRLASVSLSDLKMQGDQTLAALALPLAMVYSGKVITSNGAAVPQAVVRVWCSDCPDKELVDETQAANDGSFFLRIPVKASP